MNYFISSKNRRRKRGKKVTTFDMTFRVTLQRHPTTLFYVNKCKRSQPTKLPQLTVDSRSMDRVRVAKFVLRRSLRIFTRWPILLPIRLVSRQRYTPIVIREIRFRSICQIDRPSLLDCVICLSRDIDESLSPAINIQPLLPAIHHRSKLLRFPLGGF